MFSNEQLYDKQASNWVRKTPNSLSDFTGRPPVFELCGNVQGLSILDLGCGEGYCSRHLKAMGAKTVLGIELSAEMVACANEEERRSKLGITYLQEDVTKLPPLPQQFDLALAVFVFNYLTVAEMKKAMVEAYKNLVPGGYFIFSLPHPCFPFMREPEAPFYFEHGERGYFSGVDKLNEGKIHCVDGKQLNVRNFHKTFESIFETMKQAGFTGMPVLRELSVKPEHIRMNPEFFGPVKDVPLHIAIKVQKQ